VVAPVYIPHARIIATMQDVIIITSPFHVIDLNPGAERVLGNRIRDEDTCPP